MLHAINTNPWHDKNYINKLKEPLYHIKQVMHSNEFYLQNKSDEFSEKKKKPKNIHQHLDGQPKWNLLCSM